MESLADECPHLEGTPSALPLPLPPAVDTQLLRSAENGGRICVHAMFNEVFTLSRSVRDCTICFLFTGDLIQDKLLPVLWKAGMGGV